MRVIAGTYRSRRLVSPAGTATRPTSDRLRETLFNILGGRVAGSTFVDLYAGTGAVGIEALSRGAGQVYFAENAAAALKALRANLAALKISSGYRVEERGAMALLERLAAQEGGVDLVYVDPPYAHEAAYAKALETLGRAKMMAAGGVVIVEHATKFAMTERVGGLVRSRVLKQGESSLSFYGAG